MSSNTGTSVQSDFAKRQLERMGWKEGNGLGKDRQGRAAPIIVKQRPDVTGGLGIEKEKVRQVQHTIQDEWWKDALGDTLSKLCDKKEKKKKKRKRDTGNFNSEDCNVTETTKKKKIFTDEELFIATGGARFGTRAGKTRNQAKWRRTGELETKVEVQQQQTTAVMENTTTSTAVTECQITPTLRSSNVEAQIVHCDDSSSKKQKSKQSLVSDAKRKQDKKSDSKQKKKQDKHIEGLTELHLVRESSNTYSTVSTISSPSLEGKRKRRRKKETTNESGVNDI